MSPYFLLNILRRIFWRYIGQHTCLHHIIYISQSETKKAFTKSKSVVSEKRKGERNSKIWFIFPFAVLKSVRIMWQSSSQNSHWDLWTQKKVGKKINWADNQTVCILCFHWFLKTYSVFICTETWTLRNHLKTQ